MNKKKQYVEPHCKAVTLQSQRVLCGSVTAPDFGAGWSLNGDTGSAF